MVIPITSRWVFDGVVRGDVVHEEAGADVALVAIGIGGGAPVFASVGADVGVCGSVLVFGRVECLDGVQVRIIEEGILRSDEIVALLDSVRFVFRDEDGAFVADVAVDGGKLEVAARIEEVHGVALDEVHVQSWIVGEEGVGICVSVTGHDVLRLERGDVQAAEAGEGVGIASRLFIAFRAVHELVILVLRFVDRA